MAALPKDEALTCRKWKNSPEGCTSESCLYSHRYTGVMSPVPSATCWFWKHDHCAFNQDDCLWAHWETGVVSEPPRHFGSYQQAVNGCNAAAAQAAADAGFDNSNHDAVMELINTERNGDNIVGERGEEKEHVTRYPDYWDGTRSNLQGDYWRPSEKSQPVADRYRPAAMRRSNPSPNVMRQSSNQSTLPLINPSRAARMKRSPSPPSSPHDEPQVPVTVITGANGVLPLRNVMKKRMLTEEQEGHTIQRFKTPKTVDTTAATDTIIHDGLLIKVSAANLQGADDYFRPALSETTNNSKDIVAPTSTALDHHSFINEPSQGRGPTQAYNTSKPPSAEYIKIVPVRPASSNRSSKPISPHRPGFSQIRVRPASSASANKFDATTATLQKVKNKLLQCQTMIKTDRQAMSSRWEADTMLRSAEVTAELEELNACLTKAEEGLTGAVTVVGRLLL